jgi:hypothetical protein
VYLIVDLLVLKICLLHVWIKTLFCSNFLVFIFYFPFIRALCVKYLKAEDVGDGVMIRIFFGCAWCDIYIYFLIYMMLEF